MVGGVPYAARMQRVLFASIDLSAGLTSAFDLLLVERTGEARAVLLRVLAHQPVSSAYRAPLEDLIGALRGSVSYDAVTDTLIAVNLLIQQVGELPEAI